jgi:hypothetical protein
MPLLPPVAKVVRVDLHGHMAGDANIQQRLFFQYAGSLNTADATTWATAMATALKTFVAGGLVNEFTQDYLELTDLSSTTSPQVAVPASQVGGDSGIAPPAGLAFVLSYQIQRRYRGGKPRTYLAGVSATHLLTANSWNPTIEAAELAGWITFLTACATTPGGTAIGAITHVNVSYYAGFINHTYPSGRVKAIPSPRITPLVDVITNVRSNNTPASQRRRNEQP